MHSADKEASVTNFNSFRRNLVPAAIVAAMYSHSAVAEPVEYIIDSDHTHIIWQVDRFGFANTVGSFVDITGTLTLDEEAPEASHVAAKISLSGLRSDLPEREKIVLGPHWLDAANYPQITFTSTSTTPFETEMCETQCAHVEGTMTLHGKTAPLSLTVHLNKFGTDPVSGAPAAGFYAKGRFNRSDFGILTAIGPVGDEVEFEIQLLAVSAE